ncbi:MAG: protein kinase domain-containing protein [Bradymonadia bacterium]
MLHERYEILERLGAGGMARVYKARDTRLGRIVALKKIHEELAEQDQVVTRFQREAQVVAQLHHPHIVELHDIVELESGGMAMIMEYVEGVDLADAIENQRPLPPDLALTLIRPIADALAEAHSADIVHRDVKPANILIGVDGRLKLSDFGIAKMLEETQLTRTGGFLGTPAYIAPEQAKGEPVGPSCDQYALATVLYELITGRPPFTGANALALLNNILKGHYDDPRRHNPEVSEACAALIARGMHIDPGSRYPSVAAFGAAMGRLMPPLDPPQQRQIIALMCEGPDAAAEALRGLTQDGRSPRDARPEPRKSATQHQIITAPGEDSVEMGPSKPPVWLWALLGLAGLAAVVAVVLSLGDADTGQPADAAVVTTVESSAGARLTQPDAAPLEIAEVVPTGPLERPSRPGHTGRPRDPAPSGARDSGVQVEDMPPDAGKPTTPDASVKKTHVGRKPARRSGRRRQSDAAPTQKPPVAETPPKPVKAVPGTLALFTSPWANVYVDGKHKGRTPYLKQLKLGAGNHTLELRNPGKGTYTETIRIKAGSTLTRRVRLPDL